MVKHLVPLTCLLAGLGFAGQVAGADTEPTDFSPPPEEQQLPQKMHSAMEVQPHIKVGLTDADLLGRDNRALQAAVDYVAGLWKRIHDEPALEVRKRTSAGFSPVAVLAQLLFAFTGGGASLADAERMGKDRVLMDLLGLERGADQTSSLAPCRRSRDLLRRYRGGGGG